MAKASGPDGVFRPGEYYSLHEFAQMCKLTVRTIREKYISTGELRVSQLGKGSEIIPFHEAARFFDERFGWDQEDE